jgi:hypothetical protein
MPGFGPLASLPLAGVSPATSVLLADGLQLGLQLSAIQTAILRARLQLAAEQRVAFDGTQTLRDTLALEVTLDLVFHQILASSLELGATQAISYTAIARMVDALLLGGAVNTSAEAHILIAEAITFGAVLEGTPLTTFTSALGLDASMSLTYAAIARLIDQLALSASQSTTATLATVLSDELALAMGGTTSLDATTVLRDGLAFVLQFSIDDEQYVAWSMNTNTKGATKYTNFPFNSFMRIGGENGRAVRSHRHRPLRMEGADDAGVPIAAKLRLGMSSMGTRAQKRMASAYLGYTASGDLRVKAVVADEVTGDRTAHSYRLYARGASSMREGRVPIGKGLQAPYWDFVVENVDGADFELDVIEILPIYLERRVRGNAGGKP